MWLLGPIMTNQDNSHFKYQILSVRSCDQIHRVQKKNAIIFVSFEEVNLYLLPLLPTGHIHLGYFKEDMGSEFKSQ